MKFRAIMFAKDGDITTQRGGGANKFSLCAVATVTVLSPVSLSTSNITLSLVFIINT